MIAVSGGKGGTGKTTVALGLAAALADRRREPVVIDGDVDMPNLHLRAGVDDGGLEALAAGAPLEAAATHSDRFPGVAVVGATPGADLDRALRTVSTDRPVIVDGAAGISTLAVTPLSHAEEAVLVGRNTPAALTDTAKSARACRSLGVPIRSILLTRAERVPDAVVRHLRTGPIRPIPRVEDPVSADAARVVYEQVLDDRENA
ncbi:MAG: MinD/ParA family ATP-binding protein [Halodesulfurarchaeum sp.]